MMGEAGRAQLACAFPEAGRDFVALLEKEALCRWEGPLSVDAAQRDMARRRRARPCSPGACSACCST